MIRLPLMRSLRALGWALGLALMSGFAGEVAVAGTTTISIALDTDNDPGTGCVVATAEGSVPGIELVLSTVITTTANGATVTRLERQACAAGVLGAPVVYDNGGWNVGLGKGMSGSALVETSIPLSLLPPGGTMKAVVVAANGTGGQDATAPFAIALAAPAVQAAQGDTVAVPLTPWLVLPIALLLLATTLWLRRRYPEQTGLLTVLVLFTASGLVWAATVIRDGNAGDWNGVTPAVTDAAGDAPANADIVTVFYQQDATNLYVRVDADIRKDTPVNQAPVADAGSGQTILLASSAPLFGGATDDGLPNPPGALTYAWTKFSGPGPVTFGNASSAITSATFSVAGTYVLRLTAHDGALSGSANVTIVVNASGAANEAPVVNAGANQAITLPAAAALAGTADDDGLPNPPGLLKTTWSMVSGPGAVAFDNAAALGTTATFGAAGTYVLKLTADDTAKTSSSTMQVTVSDGAPQIKAIADRTIELGTRLQLLIEAADTNVNDALTYSLPTAPSGAALAPAPLIDWTPGAGQLGANMFTAQVKDALGHTASTSFKVTVVHTNHPPRLAPQPNVIVPVGTAFSRTLQASDPDVGDVLTFALVSGPAGMTRTGTVLNWPTAGKAPGDYAVTMKVTDAAGQFDQQQFTVTLTQAAPGPVAKDDSYKVKVGATLVVPAAGVLANDIHSGRGALAASKLTNPGVGSLSAFNADGGFTYQAPAVIPGDPLTVQRLWNAAAPSDRYHELVADLNGDGYPDIVAFDNNALLNARSGLDGSPLWSVDRTGAFDCIVNSGAGSMDSRVLADLDDSGHPALAFTTFCGREGSSAHDNIIAYDHFGKVKWVSPPLSKPHPDIRRGTTPVPPGGFTPGGLAYGRGLSAARLTANGPPVLLMRAEIPHDNGYMLYYDAANQFHYAGCRAVTGLVADENVACRATFIISGTDGSVLQTLVNRNPAALPRYGGPNALSEMPPIAMDIDGDGRVDLVSGPDVWKQNAAGGFDLAWQLDKSVNDAAVADLDGDGKAEIIHLRSSGESDVDKRGIFIYSYDGHLKAQIPLWGFWLTPLTIADVDGDGRSDIVVGADGTLYAFRDDGQPIWAYQIPEDIPSDPILAPYYTQPPQGNRITNAAPQVYDLDGDGVAEVIFAGHARIMVLDGRTGRRKVDPFWTFNWTYHDISALMLIDMNNDGHVDIVQNASFLFNCLFAGADFLSACSRLIGPLDLKSGGEGWLPGPKAFPHVQYRSTAIDANAKVLHDTTVSRVFRTPEQQGTVRDPRLAQATKFTYAASDGLGAPSSAAVYLDIVPNNEPPVFTSTPPKSLWQHFSPDPPYALVTHHYNLAAIDPDPGDTITFSLKSAPYWVTLDGPARIRFEPTCGSYGYPCPWGWTTVIVTATDSHGASTDQIFIVNLTTDSRTVPNVVGMSFDTANAVLNAVDLQGVKWVESFSAQPAGTVLAQSAVAGAVVGRFDDIRLTVSKGLQPFVMPFVVGKQLAPTNVSLTNAGLSVNAATVFSTTIPAGEIMTQSPAAGTELLPASAPPVALTVSAGGPLPAPIASIVLEPGPGPLLRLAGDELQFKAVAILTDGTSADVTLTAAWSSSLTGVATVNAAGFAKAIANGGTTITAALSGKSAQVTLNVASRTLADNTPPTASITTPANGSTVTGATQVTGTATDANFLRYELAIAPAGDETWTLIGEGTSPVTIGALGTFDPTTLVNDLYTIRLTVFDRGENQSVATTTVQLTGDRKIGFFTLTFSDLAIPMSGIPITVNRTYDSRDKAAGDFGVGWRLGLQTLRLRTNRVLGTGWVRNVAGINVSLAATDEHKVSLTLQNGQVEEFDMVVSPTANIGSLDFTTVTGFVPRSGTVGTLQALANSDLLIVGGGAEDELVDDSTLDTYDPKLFRYTSVDGVKIEIHKTEGVKKITDRYGNTVTFSAAGIIHSAGKSVIFGRDLQGRITQITDPLGNVQNYTYDGNGDLVKHANAAGDATRYAYNRFHGLIDVQDPAGNHGARNDYDASGRLISSTDARGNQITYTHNPGISQEIIRDRLGNPTLFDYDAAGNVLAKTNALGQTRTYTYDSRNNQLSETDPLGRVASKTYDSRDNVLTSTDFDGNTTVNTYNALGQVLTTVDPEGRTTTNVYDASGNLTQTTDPEGGVTKFTYDGAGRRLTSTNPMNRTTSFGYDGAGNKVSETDPLGHTTTFAYDANGRMLSVTDPAGKTALSTYDAMGRVASLTDKLGSVTTLTYSTVGSGLSPASKTDGTGKVTLFEYDALGNATRITLPDGSMETTSYDAEARVVAKTNRDGHTTTYEYDALGRKIKTTLPGGATLLTTWDAADRMLTQTDERGNTTTYVHAANQQTVTDALGHASVHKFDSRRRRVQVADALSRVTSFLYDSAGNLTRTTYPGGSFKTTTYDAAKRKTAETDQAGRTTQFTYDAAGRLIQVTNAVAGVTSYAYDAVGNRITETDANGHATQIAFDAVERVVSRTRPSGKQESFVYDANGSLLSHTDFNGQTTTFVVDATGHVTQKNLPGGATVSFAWTPGGLRAQAGGDSYTYDARGRLTKEQKASGQTLTYTHDAAGNKTSVTSPQGTTTYTHDALNRLVTVSDAAGTTTYGYDAVGNLATTAYPNGVTATYGYDAQNRLVQLSNAGPGGVISAYSYTLGPAGNRIQVVEAGPATAGRTVAYTYDAVYRLTRERIVVPATPDVTIDYTYDAVGNRTQMTRNGVLTTYTYDTSDRLVTEASGASTFTSTYDDNGNLKSRGSGGSTASYVYDAENRLVSASNAGGAVSYTYDADGMRTGKTAGGVTTTFLLDKGGSAARSSKGDGAQLAQVLVETTGETVVTYGYGHGLIRQTQTGFGTHFYLADGQWSTRQLTDASGVVTDAYTFDAFGVTLATTGATPNLYLYTGEQVDPNIGFYYLRARYYNPGSGRFLTTDPELGNIFDPATLHRYLYAHANPVDNRDPSGRSDYSLPSLTLAQVIGYSQLAGLSATVLHAALTRGRDLGRSLEIGWYVTEGTFAILGIVGSVAAYGSYVAGTALKGALRSASAGFLKEVLHLLRLAVVDTSGLEIQALLKTAEGRIIAFVEAEMVQFGPKLVCLFITSAPKLIFTFMLTGGVLPGGSSYGYGIIANEGTRDAMAALAEKLVGPGSALLSKYNCL